MAGPCPHRVAAGCLYLAWRNVVLWRLPLDGPPRETTQPAWLCRRGRQQRTIPDDHQVRAAWEPNRINGMQWLSSPWFQRKPVSHLIEEMNSGERLHRRLGPLCAHGAGHRRDDRHRSLRLDGHRRQRLRRPVAHALVPAGRDRLRVRRALLLRAGQHGPGGRQCLHLRLCDARRADRLDHRLGPDPRIRDRLVRRRHRLVELLRFACSRTCSISSSTRGCSRLPGTTTSSKRNSPPDRDPDGRHPGPGLVQPARRV